MDTETKQTLTLDAYCATVEIYARADIRDTRRDGHIRNEDIKIKLVYQQIQTERQLHIHNTTTTQRQRYVATATTKSET